MIPLPRDLCRRTVVHDPPSFSEYPIQLGMGKDVWRVAVASMLLNRTQRRQVEPVLKELLTAWPTPEALSRAEGLEAVVRPCGMHVSRARQLVRFSSNWMADWWNDLRDLPGVGVYCADAVGLFCFSCVELESTDHVLHRYARGCCERDTADET